MFNEGDRVIHPIRLVRGKVLEVDGDIVYMELDNGVEMDFPVSDLMLESEYKTPEEIKQEERDAVSAEEKEMAEKIWPEVRPAFKEMAQRYMMQTAVAVHQLGGSATPWDQLNAYNKMFYLCVLTQTTFKTWVKKHNEGKLATYQLAILMTIAEKLKTKLG